MAKLNDHSSLKYVKALYMGDPGTAKTGSLTSLVAAGYKLRIYDFDNLLGSLVQYVNKECPAKAENVSFQTFTDKQKGVDNPLVMAGGAMKVVPFVDGMPDAFSRALKQLNHWKTADEDFGPASAFGEDTVVVIDSLTSMSNAAFRYVQYMNPGARDQQAYYHAAQQLVMSVISLLGSEGFQTNVILIAHLHYSENQVGLTKGFPRAVGAALGPQIGAYFNAVLLAESTNNSRVIRTNSTGIVDLKNPAPFKVGDKLPLNTGLADFFTAVRSI